MADLTEVQASQSVKIAGANPSSGAEDNYMEVDSSGNAKVITTAAGTVTPGTVATNSSLIGGQFNTALPTLTNTQQAAIQVDSSGRIIVSPLTNSSIVKAQLQDNAGTAITVGQKPMSSSLPVVIASDQSAVPVSQSGTWTVQPGNTQNTTAWLTQDAANGSVTPGTVAAKSELMGGQFNTTLPTLTNTQQSAIQLDSSGRLLVSGISQDTAPATINITARDIASTTTVVANGQNFITGAATANSTAAFAFTSECSVVVQATGAWTGTLQVEISLDSGTTWSPTPLNQDGTDYVLNAYSGNFTGRANVAAYTNFRLRAITAWTGTATIKVIESVNPTTVYIANAMRLTDAGGSPADITANNDLQVADIVDTAGQYRAQSVTTSAAEALGAGSILANRKSLTITPTNGTIYWGYSNAVTTSSGTPIFKNQTVAFAVGSSVHIYVIAGSTTDCRITEAS